MGLVKPVVTELVENALFYAKLDSGGCLWVVEYTGLTRPLNMGRPIAPSKIWT